MEFELVTTSTAAAAEAAATATSATTTAAAEATASAATAAAFTRDHGTSFVDRHRTTVVVCAIKFADCILRFSVRRHFDKAETLAATSVTIRDDLCRFHGSALRESFR